MRAVERALDTLPEKFYYLVRLAFKNIHMITYVLSYIYDVNFQTLRGTYILLT